MFFLLEIEMTFYSTPFLYPYGESVRNFIGVKIDGSFSRTSRNINTLLVLKKSKAFEGFVNNTL